MNLWERINDQMWGLLDFFDAHGLPLGSFFDRHHLPPILFPLLLLLLFLLAVWLSYPAQTSLCGDNLCAPAENCSTCPQDCGPCPTTQPSGVPLTIQIEDPVLEQISITLIDPQGRVIDSQTARRRIFDFSLEEEGEVKVVLRCPNGKEGSLRPRKIKANTILSMPVPNGCFDYLQERGAPVETYGNIRVKLSDYEGNPASATLVAVRKIDSLREASKFIEGEGTLNVGGDAFYYLIATGSSYQPYNGEGDFFYVPAGETIQREIQLLPGSSGRGRVTVCAVSDSSALTTGRVSLVDASGSEIASATLTPQDNGCITFEVGAGKVVRAAMSYVPQGCIPPGISDRVSVASGEEKSITLKVSCNLEYAYVRVIVHDRAGHILTENTTITLWNAATGEQIPGSAPDGSLSLGSGGYTEEVRVPAKTLIQAKATSPPLGFINTVSGPGSFSPDEHASIDIILGEHSHGKMQFPGASILYSPVPPGAPVRIFIQQIRYGDTVLTPENSEVSVWVNGQRYNVTYVPSS